VAEGRGRTYAQYCGLARAAELIGERWALLIVRDLLVGPHRFTDLRRGLPRIPTNVLSERLKELEDSGIVRRRALPRPAASVVYELTSYGQELDGIVLELGLWGAQSLGAPRPDDAITSDSIVMALRATFQPERARGLRAGYELRLGEIVVHAVVDDGALAVAAGELSTADVVIETGPAIRALMAGEIAPSEALENGDVLLVSGSRELFDRFAEVFQIPPRPQAG
jgi:DNA-binding HxlR family transcriptional regulator